jgi:TM2 domain-containing membrane protein YozV
MLSYRAVITGSLLFVTTAAAQQSPPSATTLKDPAIARILGILPGAGHMYAGEVARGLLYFSGTTGILLVGGYISFGECFSDSIDRSDCQRAEAVTLIAAGGLWVWSIVDAGRAARRTNAKRAARTSFLLEPARIPVAPHSDRAAVRLGVRVSTR